MSADENGYPYVDWRGFTGPKDARRLDVYCDGGSDRAGEPRHSEVVVGRLVELRLTLRADGAPASWVFEDVEHTNTQAMRPRESTVSTQRYKIVCPRCGEDVTVGDSLGLGYVTAEREGTHDWYPTDDECLPGETEPSWARSSRNGAYLTCYADTGSQRLSLVGLRRILNLP